MKHRRCPDCGTELIKLRNSISCQTCNKVAALSSGVVVTLVSWREFEYCKKEGILAMVDIPDFIEEEP